MHPQPRLTGAGHMGLLSPARQRSALCISCHSEWCSVHSAVKPECKPECDSARAASAIPGRHQPSQAQSASSKCPVLCVPKATPIVSLVPFLTTAVSLHFSFPASSLTFPPCTSVSVCFVTRQTSDHVADVLSILQ